MNFISVKNFNSYHSCSVAKPQDTIETTGNIQQTFDTPDNLCYSSFGYRRFWFSFGSFTTRRVERKKISDCRLLSVTNRLPETERTIKNQTIYLSVKICLSAKGSKTLKFLIVIDRPADVNINFQYWKHGGI